MVCSGQVLTKSFSDRTQPQPYTSTPNTHTHKHSLNIGVTLRLWPAVVDGGRRVVEEVAHRCRPLTSSSTQRKECDLPDWSWQGLPIDRCTGKDQHHCSSSSSSPLHHCDLHFSSKVFFFRLRNTLIHQFNNKETLHRTPVVKWTLFQTYIFYFIMHKPF